MKQVQVLLSTYNGEQYISEQLESVLRQSYPYTSILVRDDGSSDHTVGLIKEYAATHPDRIQLIVGTNIGVIPSFFELLKHADPHADYYCFCDQDDVWLEGKVERAVNILNVQSEHHPAMVFTPTELADHDLKPLGSWPKAPVKPPSFYNALVQNIAVGATITINKETRDRFIRGSEINSSNIIMHDWWIYILVSAFGYVLYDQQPSMLYRQHANNVVGGSNSLFDKIKRKYRSYLKHKGKHLLVIQAKEFYMIYGPLLGNDQKQQLELFITPRTKIRERIHFLQKSRLYRQSMLEQSLFRLLILVGYI